MQEPRKSEQFHIQSIGAVRALSFPDFRYLSAAGVIAGATFLGEMVVLGWLILDLTDSSFMVGLGLAIRQTPSLLFGIPFGSVADRFPRKALFIITIIGMSATTLTTAALLHLDWLDLWHLLLLNFLLGVGWTSVMMLQQTMTHDIVGQQNLVSGLSISMLVVLLGGVLGSLGVGAILAETNPATTYGAITIAHILMLVIVLFIKAESRTASTARESVTGNLKEFFGEVRGNRVLVLLLALTAAIEVVGFSFFALMPTIARDVLGMGPDGLGLLQSVGAIGGVLSVVILAVVGDRLRRGLVCLSGLLVFGASLVWLGYATSIGMVLAATLIAMSAGAISDVLSQSLTQSVVPKGQRGRAAGAWQVAIGFGPVGHLQVGGVAALAGVTVALTINGGALLLMAALSLLFVRRLRRL